MSCYAISWKEDLGRWDVACLDGNTLDVEQRFYLTMDDYLTSDPPGTILPYDLIGSMWSAYWKHQHEKWTTRHSMEET